MDEKDNPVSEKNRQQRVPFSRREFLKLSRDASVLLFLPSLKPNRVAENVILPEPEVIEGVRVYGRKSPISDSSVSAAIVEREDELLIPGVNKKFDRMSRIEIIKARESVLPKNERHLDFVVTTGVYREVPKMDGFDSFPAWINAHITLLNEALKRDVPNLDIKIIPKTIYVVPNWWEVAHGGWRRQSDEDGLKWDADSLGRHPISIDLRSYFDYNYIPPFFHRPIATKGSTLVVRYYI
ncbi:hypothetical protein A2361_01860 [Candidatus Woesebacteria bacterium RIFOXYB1_FULL_40_26]|uniref:Uncharacterized protein n=2 Tax=Candidatus Woeseibacteriota TaxID=1752722 RepID=A0A1F8DI48_9BACT|nr:MAG: hypothetical protein A2361_01860 [Candidatus Woesebacteria bacterium RIFOXYB1_FULL_40_26]OGM87465.1 MAG: hypothetical protein A2614_02560 [Candidatus Woesebacteria bacterium RIFOXYD1_FULL_40_21]